MKNSKRSFAWQYSGFTLVELLFYIIILGLLMAAVVISFTDVVNKTTQQSTIAETKVETSVGIDLLRSDLENAGFGLPWAWPTVPVPYNEPAPLAVVPNIPTAFSSEDLSASSFNASDYLVIRGTSVATDITGQKFGYLGRDAAHNVIVQSISSDTFAATNGVIVIRPEDAGTNNYHELVMNGATYITQPTAGPMTNFAPAATPNDPNGLRYLVYGLNVDGNINRPFNRADYYINNANVPTHCAPNTGELVKATLNQANNNFTITPVVDCVADFQIVYYLDTNNDGGWDTRANANALNGLTAEQIRSQVKIIRFYILTHEGRSDRTYTYGNNIVNVGDVAADGVTLLAGRAFDLNAVIGGNWANYRWKVISMAVTPNNLR